MFSSRRFSMRLSLLGALMLPLVCTFAYGQDDQRLEQLERRLSEVEAKLKSRDEEIARLRSQIKQPTTATTDEVERTKQDILKDIEENRSSPLTLRSPVSFNPDIAVVSD